MDPQLAVTDSGPSNLYSIAFGAIFLALLLAGCVRDAQVRRIPNELVLVLAGFGIVSSVFAFGAPGLTRSLSGLATGFAVWIPFYALGMLGAGDVKFFAAAAAWLSPAQALDATLLAALAGGVLSLVWLVRTLGPRLVTMRLLLAVQHQNPVRGVLGLRGMAGDRGKGRKVPYGIAMAVGLGLEFAGFTLTQF